ncbi:hypothetical protein O181_018714 [Austropuccinia psidii MF-1]|uniref:Reverse transcriptase RNase H-like domain-containing protein n=1 Tax=Austropuccinia psidii MF-1 TaxID=1389203 RepID=A0A9Q3C873_9BASI|nr:hypothetical protein [Austropuccinia psidii MF-1]
MKDPGKHPISFDSSKLLQDYLNYEVHDKELLGIVWALKCWNAFLLSFSHSFEVLTDHSYLQYFICSKVLTPHQAFSAEFLFEFHFTITYFPGRLSTQPDALSHQDNIYLERGVDFIDNNHQIFHQILKKDGIQESKFLSIKVDMLTDLVDQIQKGVWQDKGNKKLLKKLARGESVTDYFLEPQEMLLLLKDKVAILRNQELQLHILKSIMTCQWLAIQARGRPSRSSRGNSIGWQESNHKALCVLMSEMFKQQEHSPQEFWITQASSNSIWSLEFLINGLYHSIAIFQQL